MVRVLVVEDQEEDANLLISYIEQFSKSYDEKFEIERYRDGLSFIGEYNGEGDIIFMDIKMKNMDGLEAARSMRRIDDKASLIFVTNMAQYAIKGYEVDALGFMVKPITYFALTIQLKKALSRRRSQAVDEIMLKTDDGVTKRLSLSDIYYIEVIGHFLTYHTAVGNFRAYGQLSQVERQLESKNFYRCQNSYLINLKYVTGIKTNYVMINDIEVPISRGKHKKIYEVMCKYLGGIEG